MLHYLNHIKQGKTMYKTHYNNHLLSLNEIAKQSDLPYNIIYARYKRGWRGDALTAPVQRDRSFIVLTHNGKTMTLKEWAQEIGIAYETLRKRHKAGKSVAETLHPDIYPTHTEPDSDNPPDL